MKYTSSYTPEGTLRVTQRRAGQQGYPQYSSRQRNRRHRRAQGGPGIEFNEERCTWVPRTTQAA